MRYLPQLLCENEHYSSMATDLKRKLKELLIERLKFEDMTPDDIPDDEPLFAGGLGLDSIDALEIVVMLESEFGIKVKNEASARESFKSIAALAEFVDHLRCVCLGQVLVERFARVVAKGFEIRPLRRRHGLVAGLPIVRVALQSGLSRVLCIHDGERKAKHRPI